MFSIEERWSNWAGTFTTPKAMIYEPASIGAKNHIDLAKELIEKNSIEENNNNNPQ